jgi:hypothetical protein
MWPEPVKKIVTLRAHMAAGEWRAALKLAASFGRLGAEKAAITRGWEACARPEFYRSIGKDPAALVAAGVAALRSRYSPKPPAL